MKYLFLSIFCFSSYCAADEDLQKNPNEITALDVSSFSQTPIESQSFEPKAPEIQKKYKSPAIATSLATLFPGLGHVYLGDYITAGEFAGSASGGIGIATASIHLEQENFAIDCLATLSNGWTYNIYAAYRDTRIHNGLSNSRYRMPTDSLANLASAPFSWKIMKKPEVWGGILGAFGTAILIGLLAEHSHFHVSLASSSYSINPIVALPVGIGEEAFFRGFLQSALLEVTPPWAGITISSLLFGAAHIGNASGMSRREQRQYYTFGLPFISAIGGYFGWLTYKNHSLRESTAIHMWYDFIIFSANYAVSKAAATTPPNFVFSTSF